MRAGAIRVALRAAGLGVVLLFSGTPAAAAEWQLKPFVGLSFGGDTSLIDLDGGANDTHLVFGISGVRLGNIFGIEADGARVPAFFESGGLVLGSSVTTLTANVVVALPRSVAGYGLRPYLVAGGGFMRANIGDDLNALPVVVNFAVADLGGGVTGFVSDRVGVSWDVRWFRSAGDGAGARGNSFGSERLSFWRAGMALAFRY